MSMQLRSHAEDISGAFLKSSLSTEGSNPECSKDRSHLGPFRVSAATSISPTSQHSSGLNVEIMIEDPKGGSHASHCTGETLKGSIRITRPPVNSTTDEDKSPRGSLSMMIKSLSLRFYCETRSLYWVLSDPMEIAEKLKNSKNSSVIPKQPQRSDTTVEDELRQKLHATNPETSKQLPREPLAKIMSNGSKSAHSGNVSKKKKIKTLASSDNQECAWSLNHEWARGIFSEVSLVANGRVQAATIPVTTPRNGKAPSFARTGAPSVLVEHSDELILPFQVALPLDVTYDEYNHHRGADRSHHRLLRPAPPTCRDASDASVEYVAEAILDIRASFTQPSTPAPETDWGISPADVNTLTNRLSPDENLDQISDTSSFEEDILNPFIDSRGFLLSKDSRIVTRAVYPVVSADSRVFGHDLSDEEIHSFAEGERKALRAHAGKVVEKAEKQSAWVKKVDLRTRGLGKLIGKLSVELVTHKPLYLSRANLKGSVNLFISYEQTQTKTFFGRKSDKGPIIQHVNLAVDGWSWTKGGNGKVRKDVTPLRRLKVPLDLPLADCALKGRYKLRIPFDLRTPQAHFPPNVGELIPSFKSPNVEREYTIGVSIRMDHGDIDYYIGVVPFQLTSGVAPVEDHQLGGIEEGEEGEEEEE